ncbi:uncharacterized protein PV09_03282 [Verruconis gallopava]|uniref:DUF7053 domain-containing protein n=1 Tax=Verruconis gallopava TaxID=253628 RepID=A0A0D2AHS4_9PEZI|nr:uncharacterized protein PV09_03282 [Verruconis gallopava]KIW06115.1 hypothetical protein PV09_03282 [Verruconis gallopava]
MMRKKINYTTCTPIPSYIPRQLAIELLHSHGEIITVSPLVLSYKPIKPPANAPADEYYSSWYEIEERVQFIPGVGKMGASKIKFNGCFHDLPWGLQTHVYAPAGVETRNKYRIAGNQPGEPREPVEMGIGAPPEGLYLREDVEIKCNFTMASFVKKEQMAASKVLIERMLKKAELLEEGVLQAMFENGRIKTLNPNDRTTTFPGHLPPGAPASPRPQSTLVTSGSYHPSYYENVNKHGSMPPYSPGGSQYGGGVSYGQHGFYPTSSSSGQPAQQSFAMELPGDMPVQPVPSPSYPMDQKLAPPPNHLHPANRYSTISELASDSRPDSNRRWSELQDSSSRHSDNESSSRPTSYTPTLSDGGMRSPSMAQTSFSSVPEEQEPQYNKHQPLNQDNLKRLDGAQAPHQPALPPYNPMDYAKV